MRWGGPLLPGEALGGVARDPVEDGAEDQAVFDKRIAFDALVDDLRAGVLRVAHREFKSRDEAQYVRELRALLNE